jgi:transcriptional regulator with XRE-family HTH domain
MPISAQNSHTDTSINPYLPRLSLKTIREMRGYTIDNLAVTSGLTWQEIADVENGRASDIRLLRRMATALRVSLESLPEYASSQHS